VRLGCELAQELVGRIGQEHRPLVAAGASDFSLGPSDAARAIAAEALRDDKLPLIVTCGGPLTNIAAALKLEPSIAKRMTLIWIGGGAYPEGGWEYNLMTEAGRQSAGAAVRHLVREQPLSRASGKAHPEQRPLWRRAPRTFAARV